MLSQAMVKVSDCNNQYSLIRTVLYATPGYDCSLETVDCFYLPFVLDDKKSLSTELGVFAEAAHDCHYSKFELSSFRTRRSRRNSAIYFGRKLKVIYRKVQSCFQILSYLAKIRLKLIYIHRTVIISNCVVKPCKNILKELW